MQIFDSFIDAGQELPQRDRERYYTALIEYVQYGKEPNVTGAAKAVLTAIWPTLKTSVARRDAGRAGGKASGRSRSKSEPNDEANAKQTAKQNGKQTPNQDASGAESKREPNSNSNSNKKDIPDGISQKGEPKHRHGEYGNVMLTDSELSKLKERFPSDWEERIGRLDEYIGYKGAKYKSHYLTIISWANRDGGQKGGGDGRFDKYR